MLNTYDIMQNIYGRIIDLNVGITVEMAKELTKKALDELNNDVSDKKRNEEVIKKLIRKSSLKPVELQYHLFIREELNEKEIKKIINKKGYKQ